MRVPSGCSFTTLFMTAMISHRRAEINTEESHKAMSAIEILRRLAQLHHPVPVDPQNTATLVNKNDRLSCL